MKFERFLSQASTFCKPCSPKSHFMKNITQSHSPARMASPDVVMLNFSQQLQFDPAPLQRLFAQKDLHIAEEVVCRMLENIALRLDMLQRCLAAHEFSQMHKPAKRIGLVAKQLGLAEVAMASEHVRACIDQTVGVAIEATMARLERGFDVAVTEIWNFRDL
ncbi:MAG: hypothetical protein ACJAZ1_000341 [Yoonia sp.]|jgi:hypothetical protein